MNLYRSYTKREWLARHVIPNLHLGEQQKDHPQALGVYATNRIKSTKYNIFNFVPIAFFLQFTKTVNCFYLVNMILQMIPSISTNDWFYTLIPLSCMIFLGMLREAISDYRRYRADEQVNNLIVHTLSMSNEEFISFDQINDTRHSRLKKTKTMDVRVGDILAIHDGETVPADCILLSTDPSRPDRQGQCFIQTSNLDGERNLKPKLSITRCEQNFTRVLNKECDVEVVLRERPVADLYCFQGAEMKIVMDGEQHDIQLDLEQFIPRGSQVQQSGVLYMLVIFTGRDTK